MTDTSALELHDVDVVYTVRGIDRPVLRGRPRGRGRGESYGLVGESGCGKSTAALAIVRYLARNGRVSGGSISVAGRDVVTVRVSDDGGGRAPAPPTDAPSGGFGLLGMRERVEATGGSLAAHPRPEGGFEVVAAWGERA